MNQKRYALKDIKPNPFRQIERYPIDPKKITALRESFRKTGYWGNILARDNGNGVEAAYGHHRLHALNEEYGPNHEINILVSDLDNDSMIQIMARENMEEWGTSFWIEMYTVESVVKAYGDGLIDLCKPDPKTNKEYVKQAPGFQSDARDSNPAHPYTAKTVADYLGWVEPSGAPRRKVLTALTALEYIERGLVSPENFKGLTTTQALALIQATRKETIAKQEQVKAIEKATQEAERLKKEAEKEAIEAKKAMERAIQAQAIAEKQRKHNAIQKAKEAQEREDRRLKDATIAEKRAVATVQDGHKRMEVVKKETDRIVSRVCTGVRRAIDNGAGDKDLPHYAKRAAVAGVDVGKEPPKIGAFAERLAREIGAFYKNNRGKSIEQLIKFRRHLDEDTRDTLVRALEDHITETNDIMSKLASRK